MSKKNKKSKKTSLPSYTFNRTTIPLPETISEKAKPPQSKDPSQGDNSHLFKVEELSIEEQSRRYMDNYRKAERALVINFYTGGAGAYKKGILDSIYRGFNPMNPK